MICILSVSNLSKTRSESTHLNVREKRVNWCPQIIGFCAIAPPNCSLSPMMTKLNIQSKPIKHSIFILNQNKPLLVHL